MNTNVTGPSADIYRASLAKRGVLHTKPFSNEQGTRVGHYVSLRALGLSPPQVWFLGKDKQGREIVEYVTSG